MPRDLIAGVLTAKEDLEKLIAWARSQGVSQLRIGPLGFTLGEPPPAVESALEAAASKDQARVADLARRIAEWRESAMVEWGHVANPEELSDEAVEAVLRGERKWP